MAISQKKRQPQNNCCNQPVVCAIALFALLWMQGSLLWHDTAHASHNHDDSPLCQLSVATPDFGGVFSVPQVPFSAWTASNLQVTKPDQFGRLPSLAYRSRAPPPVMR